MTIDLGDYEKGEPIDPDKYDKRLAKLQKRLSRVQVAHILHKRRAIVVLEGWDAAGKGGIISRMTARMDPRWFEVWPVSAPTPEEKDHHYLWRFWTRLPGNGEINIFDRSWYGRVLVERVEGFCTEGEWQRAYDEINAFEAEQVDDNTTIVKLFVHVTQEEQDRRFAERVENPWKRWKTGREDYRNRAKRPEYLKAMHDMFARTNTHWAPWTVIDGNDQKAARIAALEAVVGQLEARVPMEPPPCDPELARLAEEALGRKLDLD
jgi:polyphosphate kinase 2 (PPK2 family)